MPDRNPKPLPADDLLAAYELGLLDPHGRARVEAALLADPDLLEELYDAAPVAGLLLSAPGRFATAARTGLHGTAGNTWQRRLGDWFASWRRPRILVPTIGLALIATLVLWPGQPADPPAELAVLAPLSAPRIELRSAAASGADLAYAAGLDAYREEAWDAAARSFAEASSLAEPSWPRRHQTRLLEGSSLLLGGQALQAVGPLDDATGSPLPPIREQALWQLVQARLVLGDRDAARDALASLVTSPVYGERASTLLVQLGSDGGA